MDLLDVKLNRNARILWGILFILEIIVLFVGLTHEGVWYDEACSAGIIRHPLAEIWNIVKGDVHPPLYFYMLKVFSLLFGNSVFALRTFSVLGNLAFFSLGIGPVRRACGKTVGLLFSFLVTVVPIYLAAAQEIRMYTWSVFFVTGSFLYAYLAISENKTSDWIKFGVLMLAAIYTHYYALIAMIVLCGLIIIRFVATPKQFKPMFPVIAGLVALCYWPWVVGFLVQVSGISHGNFWVPPMRADIIWQTLIYPYGYKLSIIDPLANIGFWVSAGLIVWGMGAAIRKHRKATIIHWAIGVYVLTLLAAVIFSLLFWPILFARHLLPVSGLLVLGVAYGLEQLANKKLIPAFVLIFIGLMIPHMITINQSRFNGPVQEITSFLQENLKPGDVFIHSAPDTWGLFSYYFPDHKQYFYTIHSDPGFAQCRTFKPNGSAGLDLYGFIQNNSSGYIWLIDQEIVAENSVVKIFDEKSIVDIRLFKIPDSWLAVRVYKIKPSGLRKSHNSNHKDSQGNYSILSKSQIKTSSIILTGRAY